MGAPAAEALIEDVAESIIPEARETTVERSEAQVSPSVRTGGALIEATVFEDYVRRVEEAFRTGAPPPAPPVPAPARSAEVTQR